MAITPPELIEWVNKKLNERGWTQNELARQAKLTSGAISQMMTGKRPGPKMCISLAHAFDVSEETVLVLAGHSKKKPGSSPLLDELITLFFQLPTEDKEAEVATLRVRVERLKKSRQTKNA